MRIHLRRGLARIALCFTVLALAACGGGPATRSNAVKLEAPPYTMASGDKVRITVFGHADLSGEHALDGAGNFAMPLIGEVQAYGLTTRELEQRITQRLKDGYLRDPKVTVDVLNYRPFYILGEINRPGQYEYVNGMTVLNAVAMSGGFTYRAKQDGVILQRGGANAEGVVVSGDTAILPGDIVTVPERFF